MDGYVTIGTKLDTDGLDKGLTRLEQGLKSNDSKMSNMGKNSGKKFGAGFLIGFSLLTSVISKMLQAFGNSVSSAIRRVDTLNNFPKVMQNLGQSAEDSQASVDYLTQKLQKLPTTLDDAVRSVQRFTSKNNNVKASTEMFLALNNALLAGGAPIEQQKASIEQMSQAYGRGKPDIQEWKNIMTTMPAQLNQVAEVMGFGKNSADKLGEALRTGEVSMNDFMVTMVKMNKTGVNGFQSFEKQAETGSAGIQTSVANLKTAIVRGSATILQVIGQTNITNFFNSIIKAIDAVIPYIGAFVRSLMVAVTVVGKVLGSIGSLFGKKSTGGAKELNADLSSSAISMKNLGTGAGNTNKGLGKAVKSAKELNKQLAGFDEMNVLQDNKSSSGGGGGGAGGGADVGGLGDLSGLGDLDFGLGNIGDKLSEITPKMQLFVSAVWGLVSAFTAFKLLNLLKELGMIDMTVGTMMKTAVGIGLIVAGIVLIIQGVIDYLKDPTWSNFLKILGGIALVVGGVALIFGGIPALITAIILLIGALGLAIYKNWDKIKSVLSKVGDWIKTNIIDPVVEIFKGLWEKIKEIFSPWIAFWTPILKAVWETIKTVVSSIWEIIKTVFNNLKTIINNYKQIITAFVKAIVDLIKPKIEKLISIWKTIANAIKTALNPIIKFFDNLINSIKDRLTKLGSKAGNIVASAFKTVVNAVLRTIERVLNSPINTVNLLIGAINKLPGVSLSKLSTFNLPRLAKGGIINLPGSGVPIGSAIGGERGAEGVIPLTDSQQMALLGEAIGKYITVNANITNNMNGRVISRELQKIQNDNNFAYNR